MAAKQSQRDSKVAMRLKHQGAAEGTKCAQCGQEEKEEARLRTHPRESKRLSTLWEDQRGQHPVRDS